MPLFPEKESSLLAKLKKSQPQTEELDNSQTEPKRRPSAIMSSSINAPKPVSILNKLLKIFLGNFPCI